MDLKVYKRKWSDKICQRKGKRVHQQQQHNFELLDKIVWEILIRLPVESLARFRSVSKAWLAIISDPSFVRAHLQCSKQKQHENPSSFLIIPHFLLEPGNVEAFSTSINIYQWCLQEEDDMRDTATQIYKRNFPAGEFAVASRMTHCDGLMLLPTNTKVYVFNPATRDAIALPESQRNMMQHDSYLSLPVGLGLDASSGKYKVARSFYRSRDCDAKKIAAMGMEVFTINDDHGSWRETLVDPPYPILNSRNGTHYKGYLLYFIDKNNLQRPPQGLLRFSLVDETFGVTPLLLNVYPTAEDGDVFVNELGGELCATVFSRHIERVVIFTTGHVVDPDWSCRYLINVQEHYYPLTSLGGSRILLRGGNCCLGYDLEAHGVEEDERFDMDDIRYLGPDEDTYGYEWDNVSWFDLISYTESLVPVTPKASSQALFHALVLDQPMFLPGEA